MRIIEVCLPVLMTWCDVMWCDVSWCLLISRREDGTRQQKIGRLVTLNKASVFFIAQYKIFCQRINISTLS